MPLVASPGTFAGGLPGSRALPPIVQQLGHEVSSLATPGLVVARTRAVEVPSAGGIPAPVQRRAARGSRSAAAAAMDEAPAAEPDTIQHVAHEVAAAPAPAIAPVRSMPTISRQSVRVPDRPLTSAASAARPAAVQRAAATAAARPAGPAGETPAAPAPASSGGMRRVPSGMPVVSRQASASPGAPAASVAPAAMTVSSAPVVAPLLASPRLGLGEPVAAAPASARPVADRAPLVSRTTTAGPMRIAAASLRSPVQRSTGEAPSAGPLAAAADGRANPGDLPSVSRLTDLPHLPVARSASSGGSGGTSPTSTASSSATPTTVSVTPVPVIRPIAGANPLRTSIGLQREAAEGDGDEGDGADGDADGGYSLPSPWWAQASGSTPTLGGAAASLDGHAAVQRSALGSHVQATSRTESIGAMQHAVAASRSAASGAAVQRSTSAPARASMPVRGSADHSHASRTVSVPASPGPTPLASGGSIDAPVVVQTTPAPGLSPFGSNGAANTGAVPVQRAEAVPSGAGPDRASNAAAPTSERDLDELAQALFGRIRGRIRSELIHDREARGLTFDNV